MKKILAVSGGVDSVVMLDLYKDDPDVIVAHFDHGIRGNSGDDADFVGRLCTRYNKVLRVGVAKLGKNCSEAHARERRYEYLNGLAREFGGEIFTAHHADDLVESVVINVLRGTGWRGLAPMMGVGIQRPLLGWRKSEIHKYAAEKGLSWRQDPTNTEDSYLRNRVRGSIARAVSDFEESGAGADPSLRATTMSSSPLSLQVAKSPMSSLVALAMRQREIAGEVDEILGEILPADNRYKRAWFRELEDAIAKEILRGALAKVGRAATRPKLMDFLDAIRHYETGKAFNLPGDYLVRFSRDGFVLE